MPRIKKADVPKTEVVEPTSTRDESITVKRIHRKNPVVTLNPIVIPNQPNILYDDTAPIKNKKSEVVNVPITTSEETSLEDIPIQMENTNLVQSDPEKDQKYDEFIDNFTASFTADIVPEKPLIEKVDSDIKTSDEKIAEQCQCNKSTDLDFIFTPFMIKFINSLMFIFVSTFILGFNILVLTFFAWLMACMFH